MPKYSCIGKRRPLSPLALCFINDMPSRSRGAMRPSFDRVHPRKREGAGNAGCALHPRSRAQRRVDCAHEHTGSAEASGIPCVMALRLMPRSPRRRIRLVTVVGGFCDCSTRSGQSKPPPTWHQQRVSGPHGFAVRSNVVRLARLPIAHEVEPALRLHLRADALASTTSHPAFVTTRDRPSCRNGMAGDRPLIWGLGEAEFCPSCQFVARRRARACRSRPACRRLALYLNGSQFVEPLPSTVKRGALL
jgi:hypothetical protein